LNKSEKKILVCPLPWGIGHTTRMIPLIRKLIMANHHVVFAGNSWQNELIKNEIKGIECIYFPGFTIRYSSFFPQFVIILLNYPLFVYHTIREHFILKRIIEKHNPDIVISDSRIGLWNKKIISVLVTHIIRVPFPRPFRFLENLTLPLSRAVINRFTYCFIPDFPGEINLSGRLSHWCRLPENARFIGILSRFQSFPEPLSPSIKLLPTDISRREEDISYIYCTAIMSGPSPQKELLASKIKDILLKTGKNSVILSGNISSESIIQKEDNIQIINHLPEDEFAEIVGRSEIIISRSGYTTVMELFSLGRSAILIPTPGQPEQEYLAEYLSGKRWFIHLNQRNLSTNTMFELPDLTLPKFNASENEKLLNAALEELLKE